jgi:SH3-like domain-containing protein
MPKAAALLGILVSFLAFAAAAQDIGPVTGQPLPRFVSLKTASTNARRGPSLSHRVDWEFHRRGLPVRVTAEYENWRRVEDSEGAGGWVHYSLLSGTRKVLVVAEEAVLRDAPAPDAPRLAIAGTGVIGGIDHCDKGWCLVDIEGYDGWTEASNLWGLYESEAAGP